jgi:uncharacterized membrane protein YbhN (UPF0104 family)
MDDEWDDDDEMGVAAAFVLAFAIGFTATTIMAAAVAWHAVSFLAEAVQAVRGKR